MQEKSTNELDEMLKNIKPEQVNSYLMDNRKELADDRKAFYYFMKDALEAKNILLKDVYSFAGVSEGWGEKVLRMEKHTKNRDLILRFCIAGHFSLEETNRALKLYNMKPLYARDKRDVCLILAINNRKYDLADIDDMLLSQNLSRLSTEDII